MENYIIDFLNNYNVKYDLSHIYINNIFLDIKNYLLFLKFKRYNLTKKKIMPIIYNYFNKTLLILQSVINISKIKQPEQRSPEWFAIRYKIISASDASSVLGKNIKFVSESETSKLLFKNGFKSKKDLIKVKILKKDSFTGNVYTEHGVIFEEVANLIYQKRNNTNVIDFGLVLHPTINFLGASPDGITQDGIMLEIKCPYKRNLTNKIPSNYWVQMQLQLECCNLDICHFVEIKVQFYENNIDYYNDTSIDNPLFTQNNLEKGILIKYVDENNKNIYIYPSYNNYKHNDTLELWSKNTYNYYINKYSNVEFKYWKITEYSLIEVNRDVNWFKQTLPIFRDFWNKILFYRENMDEFNKDIIKTDKILKEKLITSETFNQLMISDSDSDKEDNLIENNNIKKTIKKKPIKQLSDKIIFQTNKKLKDDKKVEDNKKLNDDKKVEDYFTDINNIYISQQDNNLSNNIIQNNLQKIEHNIQLDKDNNTEQTDNVLINNIEKNNNSPIHNIETNIKCIDINDIIDDL